MLEHHRGVLTEIAARAIVLAYRRCDKDRIFSALNGIRYYRFTRVCIYTCALKLLSIDSTLYLFLRLWTVVFRQIVFLLYFSLNLYVAILIYKLVFC